ncbi:DUF2935 domain-containing protein [Clostridium formicaceticum]|uniref:DUF2935 domain-containing protein n=1 Tax=Clostridium formicaceticum TaxID=1497 RepID=A0AAC9RND0_9CLOT|nr:DUF2935 domain-containing protein [Clostridium formicaceticum]AOY77544.1 hypothetical protein BJL90_17800 [Clostridium formicaceticum]ARE88118.1 hypothetical protein CLFO_25190 [Clostridium formicaceticum]
MNMYHGYPITSPQGLSAAVDEMRFWLRIMFEHAKFIRGGLNPSQDQELFIRKAEHFAVNIERLFMMVVNTPPHDARRVNTFVDDSINWTVALRDFKAQLFVLLEQCKAVAELPAPLLDHIRREADFFLTMLYRLKGLPVPPETVLGIPNANIPTSLVPKLLIPFMGEHIPRIARDQNLFWLRIHREHGEVLLLVAYRPKIQDMLYEATAKFEKQLEILLEEAKSVPEQPTALKLFNTKAYAVMKEWHDFLQKLFRDVVECDVPSGQINAPALILDHMAREAQYYLEVLLIEDKVL